MSGCGDITGELASLTISPPYPTIGVNQSQMFVPIGKDSTGKLVSVTAAWGLIGNIGTINQAGFFTAGASSGEGTVIATVEGKTATTKVRVTENGWITGTLYDSNGKKIPTLKIYVDGYKSTLYAYSNSNGYYSISQVPAGGYTLWSEQNEYYTATSMEAILGKGQTITVDFSISFIGSPIDINPPEFSP